MAGLGFRRVLVSEGVSNFGSMLSRLAIPWVATLGLAATPLQMSALLVADVLAAALGGVLLAGWVDRHGKRSAMLLADAARAAVLALLAWSVWRGQASLALLVAAAALSGLAGAVFDLARSAWCAQQLPADELPRRNAQLSATGSLSETLAFSLGGWLYQGLGAALALAVDAISYLLSALALRGVPEARPAAMAHPQPQPLLRQLWHDARSGLALVAGHPGLRRLAAIELLLAAGGGLTGIAYMIFVTRVAGYEPGPLGLVFAVGGLGAVLGAWAAPAMARRLGGGGAMALGLALMVLGNACVPLAAAGGALGLALLVLHQLVGDGGHVVHEVTDRGLRQTLVDAPQLARADAGVRLAGQVATLAAALGGGLLGDALGSTGLLWVAVALFTAAAAMAWSAKAELRRA